MPGCRFARRSPCQGQRFSHPFFAFVEAAPTGPHRDESESNGETFETFWQQFVDMVDEGILDYVCQMSLKEVESKKENPTRKCGMRRNSVDPVTTFVHTRAGKFTVSIPLGKDAKAEDLNVTVRGRDLCIDIKSERTSEDGTSRLSQVFSKKVALPEEVKVEEVKSSLTPEGVLKIEAPLPVAEEPLKPQPVEIPVTVETNENSSAGADAKTEVDIEFPAEASE